MAARALQTVTITFGLVTIPVKMYTATNPKAGISFNLLHKCGSRVKQQYFCVEEEKVVPRDELIKGYEFEKDRYVTFSKEELEKLEEASTGAVEITEFVSSESIDPVYYDRAYYLGPDKGGAKPYRLLADAMRESKRSAIGRWAARGKQYLVNIRVVEKGLVLQTLLYADEVRSIDDVEIPEAKVAQQELALANQLIDSISSKEFHPERYKDDVKQRIEAQIKRKVEGEEITVPESPTVPEGAKVIDIMDALRASLRKQGGRGAAANEEEKRPARKAPAKAAKKAATKTGAKAARKGTRRAA
jgi:DNA end-binding protein Ku